MILFALLAVLKFLLILTVFCCLLIVLGCCWVEFQERREERRPGFVPSEALRRFTDRTWYQAETERTIELCLKDKR